MELTWYLIICYTSVRLVRTRILRCLKICWGICYIHCPGPTKLRQMLQLINYVLMKLGQLVVFIIIVITWFMMIYILAIFNIQHIVVNQHFNMSTFNLELLEKTSARFHNFQALVWSICLIRRFLSAFMNNQYTNLYFKYQKLQPILF